MDRMNTDFLGKDAEPHRTEPLMDADLPQRVRARWLDADIGGYGCAAR
jgi:hypothetical protein